MAAPKTVKADPWNVHDQVREEFAKRRKYGRTPLTDAAAILCLRMIDCTTLPTLREAWGAVGAAHKAAMISADEYRALAEEKDVCKRRIELLTSLPATDSGENTPPQGERVTD